MYLKTVSMAAAAALLGGLLGAYAIDLFPQAARTAATAIGWQPAVDYAQFAAQPGDSDATLKDKKERCWVAAYGEYPTIARRIPFGKDANLLVRDIAYPTEEERAQFKAFASVISACRSLTKAYDERTIPPSQQELLTKLDEVFAAKDKLYQEAIDGTVRWGEFAQRMIDIDRDLSLFKKQMKAKLQQQQ